MCNLYSISTNQAAISALFRVINRYVGNLPPMPGVFPDYPAPVVRNADADREMVMMRWGMPPPPRFGWLVRIGGRRGSSPRGRALKVGRFRYGLDASRTTLGRPLACNEARADRDCGRFGSARATSS